MSRQDVRSQWTQCTTPAMVEQALRRVWPWDRPAALQEMPARLPPITDVLAQGAARWGPSAVQTILHRADTTPDLVAPLLDGVDAAYFATPLPWTTGWGRRTPPWWSQRTLHACWETVGLRGWSLAEVAPAQWGRLQHTIQHSAPVDDAWDAVCAMPRLPRGAWPLLLRRSLHVPDDGGPTLLRLLARSDLRATQRAYIITRTLEQRTYTSVSHSGWAAPTDAEWDRVMPESAWNATTVALPGVLRGLRRVLERNDVSELYLRRPALIRHVARACLTALATATPAIRSAIWTELAAWQDEDRALALQVVVEEGTPKELTTTDALGVLLVHAPDACRVTVLTALGHAARTPDPGISADAGVGTPGIRASEPLSAPSMTPPRGTRTSGRSTPRR